MESTAPKAKIIIVQEEEPSRLSLRATLEVENYYVALAESGSTALEKIKRQFFDILLVDYKLPDMNGIEFIKQALAVSAESAPIVITGFSSLEIAVESMRIGAHDYLVKPVNIEDLKKNLANILIERENLNKGREKLESVVKNIEKFDQEVTIVATPDSSGGEGIALKKGILRSAINAVRAMKSFFWDID